MANEALQELGDYIAGALSNEVRKTEIVCDQLIVHALRPSIVKVLMWLRDDSNCLFKQLVDVCGVDYPARDERFDVVYNLLSLKHNQRVRVKVTTNETEPVPSVTGVFSSANWYEREVWDLYGVFFTDHPDLRRILTDYGFEGHPQRKDFPLTGYVEMRYDEAQKRVVYRPVELVQEFRRFDFLSPWEGMLGDGRLLPGDEKASKPS